MRCIKPGAVTASSHAFILRRHVSIMSFVAVVIPCRPIYSDLRFPHVTSLRSVDQCMSFIRLDRDPGRDENKYPGGNCVVTGMPFQEVGQKIFCSKRHFKITNLMLCLAREHGTHLYTSAWNIQLQSKVVRLDSKISLALRHLDRDWKHSLEHASRLYHCAEVRWKAKLKDLWLDIYEIQI